VPYRHRNDDTEVKRNENPTDFSQQTDVSQPVDYPADPANFRGPGGIDLNPTVLSVGDASGSMTGLVADRTPG